LCSCGADVASYATSSASDADYLTFLDEEPESADPQCVLARYTVPLNVFDRLVEVSEDDASKLKPSLADSWEVSEDGLVYTFHLHEGVLFSNGSKLLADDVKFSFERLLTHPQSKHQDLLINVVGANELQEGTAEELKGFQIVDDHTFAITLQEPSVAFLPSLSSPPLSIYDKETTTEAGSAFGRDVEQTVGTGPFVLENWDAGKSITMKANHHCWCGAPACSGLRMLFYSESDSLHDMYHQDKIDIMDLDMLGMDAEYFLRGDEYLRNLVRGRRVGITYVALNESVEPLADVRVRRALQMGLDRGALLQASIGGRGTIENGIFPRGLKGHNQDLSSIPYDAEQARELLYDAGYEDGFELEVSYSLDSSQNLRDLLEIAASMWRELGIRVFVVGLAPEEFVSQRNAGKLACYASTFSADYNDPQNIIYPFFGNKRNSASRSLCYKDEEVMERVRRASSITDDTLRMEEYHALEERIVHDDAAWIPLFSRLHFFVVSDRVKGFEVSWNGWSSSRYANVSLTKAGE